MDKDPADVCLDKDDGQVECKRTDGRRGRRADAGKCREHQRVAGNSPAVSSTIFSAHFFSAMAAVDPIPCQAAITGALRSLASAAASGNVLMNAGYFTATRSTCVCWSMISRRGSGTVVGVTPEHVVPAVAFVEREHLLLEFRDGLLGRGSRERDGPGRSRWSGSGFHGVRGNVVSVRCRPDDEIKIGIAAKKTGVPQKEIMLFYSGSGESLIFI